MVMLWHWLEGTKHMGCSIMNDPIIITNIGCTSFINFIGCTFNFCLDPKTLKDLLKGQYDTHDIIKFQLTSNAELLRLQCNFTNIYWTIYQNIIELSFIWIVI